MSCPSQPLAAATPPASHTAQQAVEAALQQLRHSGQIRAICLDLDDTLWPVWPVIARAEQSLLEWLQAHAPATAQALGNAAAVRAWRQQINQLRPDLHHDLSALRRESIRLALQSSGDDAQLAEPAFEVFFAARQRVDLYPDALPALQFFAQRWPVVALSNGNADVHVVGIGQYFQAALSATRSGMAKPDVRFFHAAAQALDVAPEHVLHIGDDAALDAVGAMEAGMQAVWLNREALDWPHSGPKPPFTVSSLSQLCAGLAD